MKGVSSMRLGLSDGGRGLRMGDILSPRPALTQAHHAGRRWGQHGRKPQEPSKGLLLPTHLDSSHQRHLSRDHSQSGL